MRAYLVDVTIRGRVRVEADSTQDAEYKARSLGTRPILIGTAKLFEPKVEEAMTIGPVEHYSLSPRNVKTILNTRIKR